MLPACLQAEAVPPATGPVLSLLPSYQGSQNCLNNALLIEQHGGMPAPAAVCTVHIVVKRGKAPHTLQLSASPCCLISVLIAASAEHRALPTDTLATHLKLMQHEAGQASSCLQAVMRRKSMYRV